MRRARGLATRPVFYYNDVWEFPLPENHRFPMAKYRLVREALQAEGVAAAFEPSPLASLTDLTTTHCRAYCERFVGGKLFDEESILVDLNVELRKEIALYNTRALRPKTPVLKNSPQAFFSAIATHLRANSFFDGDMLIAKCRVRIFYDA